MNAMITVLARNRTESGRKRAETVIPHQSLISHSAPRLSSRPDVRPLCHDLAGIAQLPNAYLALGATLLWIRHIAIHVGHRTKLSVADVMPYDG
jgi:hypothetical protein